ncbi:DUF302 domain-containing protein [Thermus scotoductus]|uniref:ABC transporter ATP-binding protein n=2 Tax=Thermus scotoductus TaxID=37636 RepID=A0A0N1KPJ8_THESC|nr:DUF302 domain-containing protein [Thermus scotoductus]KPD29991.1 ABC transporter ATP-binding protein [Thermus scotoductus]RTG97046.1 DUF302 domain-containing protein [Thermus scotoductus]RTH21941.1 DUF302 domain-containing protein [Thermus scotoductus]RTH33608.1 DUF302 domain-containing protein [Thermus scotoductus]RTI00769.1 DUF302 domain-containing protein [Thermus scotoductus]
MTDLRKTLKTSLAEARARLETALREEGFGILTEIDVAATLKARLGLERPPYLILGACNPSLAAKALEAEPDIGLLLPCNAVLKEGPEGVEVLLQDPREMFRVLPTETQEALKPVAEEARNRLEKALAKL